MSGTAHAFLEIGEGCSHRAGFRYNLLQLGLALYHSLHGKISEMERAAQIRQESEAMKAARAEAFDEDGVFFLSGDKSESRSVFVEPMTAEEKQAHVDQEEELELKRKRLLSCVEAYLILTDQADRPDTGWPRSKNWSVKTKNCFPSQVQSMMEEVSNVLGDCTLLRKSSMVSISSDGAMPQELGNIICTYLAPNVPSVHKLLDMVKQAQIAENYHKVAMRPLTENQMQTLSPADIDRYNKQRRQSMKSETPKVKQFLNRILGLPIPTQNML